MLRSPLLEQLDWVEHGFGTRSDTLSQDGMASLKQIHSAVCLATSEPSCTGEGDALITAHPGLAVSVRTADCYPVLLADPVTRSVASVHAGWRGTAAGVVRETIARMMREFRTQPAYLWAAIGPGIGGCCYEVGAEVARKFGLDSAGRIDLASANRTQLIESGVRPERIDVLGVCTFCDPARFHSFRRDKESAGRMISFIRAIEAERPLGVF